MVPVYARMIGLDTMYLERTTRNGTTGRLLALERSPDGEKVVQFSYVFTQPGQWRNLIAQPELLSALQPNDVRPAGTCDITGGRGPELTDLQLRRRPADQLPARAAGRHRIARHSLRGAYGRA